MNPDVFDALKNCVLFSGLSASELEQASDELNAEITELPPHSPYYMTGQKITDVAVVINGSLNVSLVDSDGHETLVNKTKKGYLCGVDIACTATRISPYEIYTIEGTTLFNFEFDKLRDPMIISPEIREKILWNLILFLSNNNIRSQYRIEVLACITIRDKVLNYLFTQARKLNRRDFTIPFSREEMANYLSVNRSALSHELSLMKQEGIIDFRKNHFIILKEDWDNFGKL